LVTFITKQRSAAAREHRPQHQSSGRVRDIVSYLLAAERLLAVFRFATGV
jgi:hypothetical protein